MAESKTVRVTRETWRELHERKDPGQTMDEVIVELIDDESVAAEP